MLRCHVLDIFNRLLCNKPDNVLRSGHYHGTSPTRVIQDSCITLSGLYYDCLIDAMPLLMRNKVTRTCLPIPMASLIYLHVLSVFGRWLYLWPTGHLPQPGSLRHPHCQREQQLFHGLHGTLHGSATRPGRWGVRSGAWRTLQHSSNSVWNNSMYIWIVWWSSYCMLSCSLIS